MFHTIILVDNNHYGFTQIIYLMQVYHSTSVPRAQAIRLFHLIQECSLNPSEILQRQALTQFLHFQQMLPQTDIVTILHQLDKHGRQMNQQYWGQSVSNALADAVNLTENDIGNLHNQIKDLLKGSYMRPMFRFEQWDQNKDLNQSEKGDKYLMILEIEKQLFGFTNSMDLSGLENYIQRINFCLSICTLSPSFKADTIRIYEQLLKGNFIEILRYTLTINIESHQFLVNILKSLCYIFTVLKYDHLKKIISSTFLCQVDTLLALIQNIADSRIEIKYYAFVMTSLATYYLPEFSSTILINQPRLKYVSSNINMLDDNTGMIYGLQILINLMKSFSEQDRLWKKEQVDIAESIFNFGMSLLKNQNIKQRDTQVMCLKLLSACIKFSQVSENNIRSLAILNTIFENRGDPQENNNLTPLVREALDIIENLLIFTGIDTKSAIINDKNFQLYFCNSLKANYEPWLQHAKILQIALVLSRPENSKYLFENNIISSIFQLYNSKNGCTKLYLSQIILNLLLSSLYSQWMLTYLYENKLLQCIGNLLKQSFVDDEILTFHYSQNNMIFFTHKQVYINCIRALYMLTDEHEKEERYSFLKKCEFYKKSFSESFIDNFAYAIQTYFESAKNQAFLKFNLNERHSFSFEKPDKKKMLKMMTQVVQEMTIHLRARYVSNAILKKVHKMRNIYLEHLYAVIPINQLDTENIPVYYKLKVIVNNQPARIERVYRLNWSHLQYYIADIIKKMYGYEPEGFKIQDFKTTNQIKNQYDYRRYIDRILSNYQKYNFEVQLNVFDILERKERTQIRNNSMQIGSPGSRRMYPGDNPNPVRSQRIPLQRDRSPYSQRIYTGQQNYNYQRSQSPSFGGQGKCKKCQRITTNNSKICNACIGHDNIFR